MTNYIEDMPYTNEVKQRLGDFVSALEQIPEVTRIILFGSYARFEQKATSDLDILALTSTEISRDVRGELCSIFEEKNSDLIFYTKEQFESSNRKIAQEIRKDGILLWKR